MPMSFMMYVLYEPRILNLVFFSNIFFHENRDEIIDDMNSPVNSYTCIHEYYHLF